MSPLDLQEMTQTVLDKLAEDVTKDWVADVLAAEGFEVSATGAGDVTREVLAVLSDD
jgi:hypothetical protein